MVSCSLSERLRRVSQLISNLSVCIFVYQEFCNFKQILIFCSCMQSRFTKIILSVHIESDGYQVLHHFLVATLYRYV